MALVLRELAWLVGKPRLVATGTKSLVSMATASRLALTDAISQRGPRRLPHALVPRTAEHRRSQSSSCPVAAPSLPTAAQLGAGTAGHRTATIPHAFSWEPLLSRGLRSCLPIGKGTSGGCAELWGPKAKAHLPWLRLQHVAAKGGTACGGSRHCISL